MLLLKQNDTKSPATGLRKAVLSACKVMMDSSMLDFMERDVPFLLRKIPTEVQEKHYHSADVHIKELLLNAGPEPAGGMELAAATVRGLFLTASHRENVGPLYPQVLDTLVRGACQRLFPKP